MKKEEIKIPQMGESISEASIGALLKSSGSQVAEGDEIVELETEKVNQVLYAPCAGILTLNVKVGDTVKIGDVIGDVDREGSPEVKQEPQPEPKLEPKLEQKNEPKPESAPIGAPSSGKRIMPQDFVKELKEPLSQKPLEPTKAEPAKLPRPPREGEIRKPLSKIRKTIARRLVDSLHTAAMLTSFNEVDMSAVIALREKHRESFLEKHGVKLGFMSFFVKAVVEALKSFPDLNSYLDGDEIVTRQYYDIGIAVGTERGLVVPVVRGCEFLSFADIEKTIAGFAKKARSGKLEIADLEGGSFTITNGGVYGSMLSTPILNPPQVGILGMHNIVKRAVVVNDEIVIRPIMYLALSYDHRLVDGKEAVTFLVRIKRILEDPSSLLFDE